MPPSLKPVDPVEALPDPGEAGTLDALVERLRALKRRTGDPSYETITARLNQGRPPSEHARKNTVADCFRPGRRRLNAALVVAVVEVLHPDPGYAERWRQALRVIRGEAQAASQVRVHNRLPDDLPTFTGRTAELDRILPAATGEEPVVVAVEGMAGVGKTQLAVHAGHLLTNHHRFDTVLYVDLRGFHPDPALPPADPAATLDGFLRLLGVPGQSIPYDLQARSAAFQERLATGRALVVLDNAAGTDQIRPLLPDTPGSLTLITSRRGLTALPGAQHVVVDVFDTTDAMQLLAHAAPHTPPGPDPSAAARIAERCGYLPLALEVVTGHMRARPGWTLTDHADRLDERHHNRRLDSGVELALDLTYQDLPADRQRALRLLALHPGPDLDAYAVSALTGGDQPGSDELLRQLHADHLLQQPAPQRYTLHDLVRAHAITRAVDEEPPPQRRAALTRLFDHYLATAAVAMDTLFRAEAARRPRVAAPRVADPSLTQPQAAHAWLDSELPALLAVAGHAAEHGWPGHTTMLSATLYRYLSSGYPFAALTLHQHARQAALSTGDVAAHAGACLGLGVAHLQLGRPAPAAEQLRRAGELYQQAGDPAGQARALANLGIIDQRQGRYREAAEHVRHASQLYRQAADEVGEAASLLTLGAIDQNLDQNESAADHLRQALTLFRRLDYPAGEAAALNSLGLVEGRTGRHTSATENLGRALTLYRQIGNRTGEASVLDSLGTVHTRMGDWEQATTLHRQSLAILDDIGERHGEADARNGLGEAARAAGHLDEAVEHHTAALTTAEALGQRDQQARAHTGLGYTTHDLGDQPRAEHHLTRAVELYTELGMPRADEIRAFLSAQP
ncbi:tetratricopeptide repeat protein [Actinoplanes sp. LDG1-06]|uniref:Tetratricopeptide repeat protein n=1 Tax=Paractinoplanes ovalisporus TaxID=2810368 RepID=A0ABS2A8F4_9ACTN|nr:tetratricopeptide repeat protein [Actinoplanes ovalisporus]MBM2616134.1 tetratricopeptide repeat protein [Actinoplanes ovalisporus]